MTEIRIQSSSDRIAPGESYRIPILVVIDQPLKVRGLHASFHGAEETKATYTTYNAATKSTQTHTVYEYTDFVKTEFLLSGQERKGFFGNIADALATMAGGGEHEVLGPGEYPFEVQVQIPANARSTFSGQKCSVFYRLSAHVDIPVWRDVKATHSFQLTCPSSEPPPEQGSVRTRYPEDQDRGLLDAWMGPDIRAEAALAERVLYQGAVADGIFTVETPKPLRYRSISARLIAIESVTAQDHSDSYTHLGESVLIARDGQIESKYSQTFQIPIVNPGLLTSRGDRYSVECYVQIELDVPWAKDPKIRIPVTLL